MAYQELASLYDRLMQNAPYEKWINFTRDIFKRNHQSIHTILDLGCGTGEITTRLAREGFQMMGVDYSSDMLTLAQQKAVNGNLAIEWIHQDIRMLEGFTELDAVISYCDVINYITTIEDIDKVFINVANCLKPGGIFIFDIHSIGHAHHNMSNHTFTEVEDDFSYIWDCTEGDELGEMHHELTFFIMEEDGKYRRFDEYHHQLTYAIEIYEALLIKSGFENIQICSDFNIKNEKPLNEAERIFFFAEKRSRSL